VLAATPLGERKIFTQKSAGLTRMSALSGRIVYCCGITPAALAHESQSAGHQVVQCATAGLKHFTQSPAARRHWITTARRRGDAVKSRLKP